jgi:hypothetical protein
MCLVIILIHAVGAHKVNRMYIREYAEPQTQKR